MQEASRAVLAQQETRMSRDEAAEQIDSRRRRRQREIIDEDDENDDLVDDYD